MLRQLFGNDNENATLTIDAATPSGVTLHWSYFCDNVCTVSGSNPTTVVTLQRQAVLLNQPAVTLGTWAYASNPYSFVDTTAAPGVTYSYYVTFKHESAMGGVVASATVTTPGSSGGGGGGGDQCDGSKWPVPSVSPSPHDGTGNATVVIDSPTLTYTHYNVLIHPVDDRGNRTGPDLPQWDSLYYDIHDTRQVTADIGPLRAPERFSFAVQGCMGGRGLDGSCCSRWSGESYSRGGEYPTPKWHVPAPLASNQFAFNAGAGIAGVARLSNRLDLFTIGDDGRLWNAGTFEKGGWNPPFPVVQSHTNDVFQVGGGIAAVSRTPDRVDTFTIGFDGRLWSPGHWTMSSGWGPSEWIATPGNAVFKPGGGIAAVARNANILDTFAIGYDGYLWSTGWWDYRGWHEAYPVPRGNAVFQPGGGIGAGAVDADHVYTFAIGYDGQLWSPGWWNVDHWEGSFKVIPTDPNVHFAPGSQIGVTVQSGGQLDVWVIGYDHQLWNAGSCNWSQGTCFGRWGLPYKVEPTSSAVFATGGGIAATARMDGLVDLDVIGFDNHTWSAGWYGTTWP